MQGGLGLRRLLFCDRGNRRGGMYGWWVWGKGGESFRVPIAVIAIGFGVIYPIIIGRVPF